MLPNFIGTQYFSHRPSHFVRLIPSPARTAEDGEEEDSAKDYYCSQPSHDGLFSKSQKQYWENQKQRALELVYEQIRDIERSTNAELAVDEKSTRRTAGTSDQSARVIILKSSSMKDSDYDVVSQSGMTELLLFLSYELDTRVKRGGELHGLTNELFIKFLRKNYTTQYDFGSNVEVFVDGKAFFDKVVENSSGTNKNSDSVRDSGRETKASEKNMKRRRAKKTKRRETKKAGIREIEKKKTINLWTKVKIENDILYRALSGDSSIAAGDDAFSTNMTLSIDRPVFIGTQAVTFGRRFAADFFDQLRDEAVDGDTGKKLQLSKLGDFYKKTKVVAATNDPKPLSGWFSYHVFNIRNNDGTPESIKDEQEEITRFFYNPTQMTKNIKKNP